MYPKRFFHIDEDSLRERQLHLSADSVPSVESLASRSAPDISYTLSAVVMDGDILCGRSLAFEVDHYTFYGPARSQGRPDKDAPYLSRLYYFMGDSLEQMADGGVDL